MTMSRSFSAIACLIALGTALPALAPGSRTSFPLLKRQSGDPYNEDWYVHAIDLTLR